MRRREKPMGNRNCTGARITLARERLDMKQKDLLAQIQVKGIEMNASGLSKIEGQNRYVMDFELKAFAEVLGVSVDWLLGGEQNE
ncbi:helix-turn-helix domain-containing protein [Anaeromassilibacillus senegalensis]|uniref:helix-turn-helix domain-containing protein n=1 Tax=Anaeromassilibacillus senegalensis TaxID=1673717 RepID=UPI0006806E06|nr:helix-turn-helix domain-containing protein [Anaeromassilibacillus senegalensis]